MSGAQQMANNNVLGHGVSNGVVVGGVGGGGSGGVGVNNLRDVRNFLQPATVQQGGCPYDHIIEMMRGLDLQDDGIVMNHKIKSIETDFCHLVRDENMLSESMEYINDKALADNDIALKFALLFSSRNFDVLAMNDTKVRSAMLKILETNFINADAYRVHDKDRLYNSITLLGEYYHRVRLADNSPIIILGESLLSLLIREVSQLEEINVKLAKLILSQITLNGDIMRVKHQDDLIQLLFHVRRNLIEQPSLKPAVKALLLMTLDLYYSGFKNLGSALEEMYTKYLVQENEDEGNNNMYLGEHASTAGSQMPISMPTGMPTPPKPQQQSQSQPQQQQLQPSAGSDVHNSSYENGDGDNNDANDSYESQPCTKKWSEQVCEDSLYESEFGNEYNNGTGEQNVSQSSGTAVGGVDSGVQENLQNSNYNEDLGSSSRNARRAQKPRNSPRPLKHQFNSVDIDDRQSQHNSSPPHQHQHAGEERDQTKPLPRWRVTRFNREGDQQDGRPRNQHRRYSASFDDDHHSVRSEGGSIRLYSINDRLRHSQEKIERSGNNYNSIANSNWDQQSQHDDRSERSYASNYERGNFRRGGRHYNNRQSYDKPPRFQKNQQQQQHPQQHQNQRTQHQQHNDNKIHSDSWRRSRGNLDAFPDENSSFRSNGPESNSRSSSRARTLPRPGKSHFEGANARPSYRRSQSPSQSSHQQRPRNYNNAGRYSSQSSLASEASSTFDRRHNRNRNNYGRRPHQRQQNDWEETRSVHGQPEEQAWENKNDNSELVRNARQTTKYMNYLSSKK